MTSPFPRKLRAFILLLPYVFLLTAIIGSSSGFLIESRNYAFELLVILFATSPHGIFTFSMVRLPEVSAMIAQRTDNRPWRFWAPAIPIFAIGFIAFITGQDSMPVGHNAMILSQLFIALFAYHHGIKQNLGFSLIYNARLRKEGVLSENTLKALGRSEKIERWCFHFFLPSYLTFLTFDLLSNLEGQPGILLLTKQFIFAPKLFTVATVGAMLANAAWITFRTRDLEKMFYIGRMSLFGAAALGLPPVFMSGALLAAHATEYLAFYGTIQTKSRASKTRKVALFAFAISLTAVLLPLIYLNHAYQEAHPFALALTAWLPLLRTMAAVEGGLALVHYYLDRQIFRVRIPAVRAHVTPLFEPDRAAS